MIQDFLMLGLLSLSWCIGSKRYEDHFKYKRFIL